MLKIDGLTYKFGKKAAVDCLSFEFTNGVYGLLGPNGSGKTTLMRCITGLYNVKGEHIFYNGKPVEKDKSFSRHVGYLPQKFGMYQHLTLNEMLLLIANMKGLDDKSAREGVEKALGLVNLTDCAEKKVKALSGGMVRRAGIAQTLLGDPDILIFDEPTAVLMPQEIEDLIAIMRSLVARGKSIILITHKPKEIEQVADRCVSIRRGQLVDTVNVADTTTQEMADKMVGRVVHFNIDKQPQTPGECVLKVEHLSVDFSFDIHAGEIVGIAGVDGNGQTELVNAITGLGPVADGKITLCGQDITHASVSKRIAAGISHIPEDRQRRGLVLDFTLEENIVLGRCGSEPFSAHGVLKHDAMRAYADRIIEQYDVRCGEGARSKAGGLSCGNQQKAIVGREIERPHELLIAFQPIRGMDVGSIEYIHNRLLDERSRGKAVLLVSLELDEVLQLSDRILAINQGRLIGEVSQAEATESIVGHMMAGMEREAI